MPLNDHAQESGPILVTGARGFVGSQVIRRLRERNAAAGDSEYGPGNGVGVGTVIGLVREDAGDGEIACNLHDANAIRGLIRRLRPSACVHAAWEIDPAKYRSDERNDQWVETSLRLMEMLHANGCAWMGVFGTCIETATVEGASCRYAAAKTRLRETMLAADYGPSICWWKLFQPYGPGEPAIRFVPSMLRTLAARQPFTVNAPADIRDFIHVSDIADAVVACLQRRVTGVYELGTGEGTTLEEAARVAAELLGVQRCVRTRAITEIERGKASTIVASPAPLSLATGWQPRVTLAAGFTSLLTRSRSSPGVSSSGGVHAA
jgi:nucleoside-diphosphate-sugar epimerase